MNNDDNHTSMQHFETQTKKRKFEHDHEASELERPNSKARVVASHYNARPDQGIEGRKNSPIIQLRSFNNWIKSVLIGYFVPRKRLKVLDVACGKGGDIGKWARAGIEEYVGIDIAELSIEQAKSRFEQGRNQFKASFHVLDCFGEPISKVLQPHQFEYFDVVSTQFALHYAFETEQKATLAVKNIASTMRRGAVWIGTVPNSNWIVKSLRLKAQQQPQEKPVLKNDIYSITPKFDIESPSRFGAEYVFRLEDAIDDCPEYLIHWPTLCEIANKYGLKCILKCGFHEWFRKRSGEQKYQELLYRMNVLNEDGSIGKNEWEVAGVYLVFAFEKK